MVCQLEVFRVQRKIWALKYGSIRVDTERQGKGSWVVLGGTGACPGFPQAEHSLDKKNGRYLGHKQSLKDVEEYGIMGNHHQGFNLGPIQAEKELNTRLR